MTRTPVPQHRPTPCVVTEAKGARATVSELEASVEQRVKHILYT